MFMNADVVVLLPGGAGSLDEVFEVLTWRQLGLHKKQVYIVNTNVYWSKLIDLMNHVVTEGFAADSLLDYMTDVPDIDTLMRALRAARSSDSVCHE
jgi:uncharacterized protein (TIGR00730 family)